MLGSATLLVAFAALLPAAGAEPEKVGVRPYEMDWAGRTEDAVPPLVDFEDLAGWRVESRDAEARLERTREQQIWGKGVAKLTYRGAGPSPEVLILPPAPLPIPAPFDAVTLWVYGNNWGWAPDPETPQVEISVVFEDSKGAEFRVRLWHVDWTEWNLLHKRLDPGQIERAKAGAKLKAIAVSGGRNRADRSICIDNLAVFAEKFPPLTFAPRPERGIPMFPGQGTGTNTGPGKLPFPNRPETICPENLASGFTNAVRDSGTGFDLVYEGPDGKLLWRYEPRTGTLGDITARWEGRGGPIRPCAGGGVRIDAGGKVLEPEAAEHLGSKASGGTVESRWRLRAGGTAVDLQYVFAIRGKSLRIDVIAPGGGVAEVRLGRAEGLRAPRLVKVPFYLYSWGGARPSVAVSGPPEAPLFLAGHPDWCLSNGSTLFAENAIAPNGVTYTGGARYIPKTDGERNDCFERIYVALSPRFEEVLPTIPNPPSPWKGIAGTHVWRAHGAGDRKADLAFWTECRRRGMTQVVITDHETGWRDGGESFTFRTRAAPGKGGDEGQREYARAMIDRLGFVYGPYNNYTDFAPVNGFWSFDMVSRTPENQLQHAWMRCYAPKPARAVECCERLAPEIQAKFGFRTAYCDVHTAVSPWDRTDYDARVPGAGTFAAVFYSYGEIMLHQKKAWGGPVYSEGTYHYLYCGLTDGNYGQDNPYKPWRNPWLVDFDLRKMHDLACNFGMGAPSMFYGDRQLGSTPAEVDASIDRFLAATVAFGHPGFLSYEGGSRTALRSYFLVQAIASRYCMARAEEILYAGADGRLLDTSAAVASGAFERSQVAVRYSDGTCVVSNGNTRDRMKATAFGRAVDLPPDGFTGWTADGSVLASSGDGVPALRVPSSAMTPGTVAEGGSGHRADYAEAPSYLYVDGRGTFARFPKAASAGAAACKVLDGKFEVIPYEGVECGFAVRARAAKALDKEGKEIGPAGLRRARGLTYVLPVQGAFSYVLEAGEPDGPEAPTCDRDEAAAGERVAVRGKEAREVEIPKDAKAGERVWLQVDGGWIDFAVVPAADFRVDLEGNSLRLEITNRLGTIEDFTASFRGKDRTFRIGSMRTDVAKFDIGEPKGEAEEIASIEVRFAGRTERIERAILTRLGRRKLADLPARWQAGIRFRGGAERSDFGDSGGYAAEGQQVSGGVSRDGIRMHPPYMGGVGYAFVLYEPLALPPSPPAAFRALVGKGDGSDPGDGILYRVIVVDDAGAEAVAGEATVTRHEWRPIEADLSRWAGRKVRLKLVADVGSRDDSSGDWAAWTEMRLEARDPALTRSLVDDPSPFLREPGPFPAAGLKAEDLRKAKAGWLRYEGKGLEGGDRYPTSAVLNGVEVGRLAQAGGDETRGVFVEAKIPLAAEAIGKLGLVNALAIRNAKGDAFSIRRIWIDLELADGRRASSQVAASTWTQPSGWKYAEGIGVPAEKEIEVILRF
jgi:hypothetical protein